MANYTVLTPQELDALLNQYALEAPLQVSPLAGGQANSSLKITTSNDTFTLSICDEKDREAIENLTDILVHLEEHKFPTTRLIKTKKKENFVFHKQTPVYMKNYLQGKVTHNLSAKMIHQVGQAMANLHSLKCLPTMQNSFACDLNEFESLLSTRTNHPYYNWLIEKKNYLEQAINPDLPKGFIHGDIFWDNLLFENESLKAILDFEEACYFYKLFDIGMAAVGCCSSNGSFNISQIRELLDGYSKNCPFTSDETSQLNIFIEYAAVAASFWRFRQYNVKYPKSELAESYKELASLADHIHTLSPKTLHNAKEPGAPRDDQYRA